MTQVGHGAKTRRTVEVDDDDAAECEERGYPYLYPRQLPLRYLGNRVACPR